jgi:hypothetical protein
MNTEVISMEGFVAPAETPAPKTSFFSIPGDPAIPTLVRVYGTIIRMANAVMVALALVGLFAAMAGNVPGFAVACLFQIVISLVLFAVGTSLRNGSKAAVHGVAALAALDIISGLLLAAAVPQAGFFIGLATILGVGIVLGPPIFVAYWHWEKFH